MTEQLHHSASPVGAYAPVNGLNLYYEIHGGGAGVPLVLIHGGLGGIGMFPTLLPALAQNRKVIAVELQGHGHTADIDRPFRFELMADDIAALVRLLKLDKVDLLGYSLGGGATWQTVLRHPELVRKLVAVSAPVKRKGWYPEVLASMGQMNAGAARAMIGSPPYEAYVHAAPRPEDWPVLVGKTSELLKQEYDWSSQVAKIKAPIMIVAADADSFSPAYAAEMFGLLGGGKRDAGLDGSGIPDSRLAILPGATHYNIIFSPVLAPAVIAFLDEPVRG